MQKEIEDKIFQLLHQQQSLFLSTLSKEVSQGKGVPHSSYAPYVSISDEQALYVFLSDLSEHSHYLRANPNASILIIADEVNTEQIFARVRVQYLVSSQLIENEKERIKAIKSMHQRFGEIIDVLSSLSDFRVYKLTPQKGRYIEGFGRAFNIGKGLSGEISPVMQDKNLKSKL